MATAASLTQEITISTLIEKTLYEVRSARLPSSFDRFCIAQISDVHDHQFGLHQERLLELVREAHPDLIAITGDLVYEGWRETKFSPDLPRELSAIAPAYFVTGNHEIRSDHKPAYRVLDFLEDSGVSVLRGASALIFRGEDAITIAGVDDPRAFGHERASNALRLRRWSKMLTEVRDTIKHEFFSLLLSHRPELISHDAQAGSDLVLAGHAHGGQIRFPLIGALYAADQGLLPPYVSGMHTMDATTMIVSRGLGSSRHMPVRVLNRPEIVFVRLRAI